MTIDFHGYPIDRCAVACVRVSTEVQAERYGPVRQRGDIEREAAERDLHLVHWVEEAISGTNQERAVDNQFFDLARQYPGLNFIFSHPNRVGRHVEVTVGIARTIHRLGGTMYIAGVGSIKERRSWSQFLTESVGAEQDYSNIRYNLATGQEDKARRGLWPHGVQPWGYLLERDSRGVATLPRPVPELAAAVRRLFDLGELQGDTLTLDVMRSEGWPAPTAAGWTRKSIHNLLTNPHYTGVKVFRGITVSFEPIISPEQFARVQARRSERRTHSSGHGTNPLLLTGHLRCSVCGASLVRDVDSSRYTRVDGSQVDYGGYVLYRCYKGKRGQECTNKRRWREHVLDELCWATLSDTLSQPALLAQVAAPPPAPEVVPTGGRMAELESAIDRAWRPFANGRPGYSEAMAERMAAPYTTELLKLQREQAARPLPVPPDYEARSAEFRALLLTQRTPDQQRQLLRALNVRFFIGLDGVEGMTLTIP